MDEWLTDEFGKRYRMRGNVREYEMMITVGGGISIPESQLSAYNRGKAEAAERERKAQEVEKPRVYLMATLNGVSGIFR